MSEPRVRAFKKKKKKDKTQNKTKANSLGKTIK